MRACLCACAALVSLLGVSVLCAAASPVLSTQSTVVLITGDRVTFKPGDPASLHLHPRKGREHIGFSGETRVFAGESKIYVIPDDARRLIASHRIDRELFNVTALAEIQRRSATKDSVPIIVTYSGSSPMLAAAAGVSDSRTLNVIHAIALKASLEQIERLWDSVTGTQTSSASGARALGSNGAFQKIWLDRIVQTSLDQSVQQIGAPSAWSLGLQGDGVVIGVLDSGVDLSHPDLAGQVIAHQNFTSEADDVDHFGHGTHVASIIAGTGSASGGKYRGVAPHATLISAKVCDDQGYCALSDIVRGMEWAVTEQGAKIVNLSLGKSDDPEIDPAEQAINELSEQYGVLFVAAAGNDGAVGGVGSPGTADAALSVAAVDRSDGIAPFSSQGPRAEGGAIKPEISAPGVGIVAARASGAQIGDPVGDSYVALSGTSMATPHVTGAAALLAQLHPEWGPQQLKSVLIGSSRRNPDLTSFQQGAGRVDVVNALRTSVTAEPMTLGFDTALWPHDDDMPISRTVTYRNEGAEPLTLNFRLEAKGPNGEAAPSGMFTFSPATLSVPVGGSATATVTANTRANAADGLYSGALIAAIDSQTFTVPFAI